MRAVCKGKVRPSTVANIVDPPAAYAPVPNALAHAYWSDPAPQTMLIEDVESIWAAIAQHDDWQPFHAKLAAVHRMGEARADRAR